ncbi:mitochondrial carrier protein [Aureococcus anophagefferens]|nr:mitochondrial carrier protein [Aureococcus anophagefferens]
MSMRKPIAPHERAQVNVLGVAASGALGAPLVIPAGKEGPDLGKGPLSRFGDTAANTGTLVILNEYDSTKDLPAYAKTAFCSVSAASWRLFLMPIDTLKTTLQTDGAKGMALLRTKMASGGPLVLYNGGAGAVMANIVGYYPLGFAASAVSDCSSNSIRVLKVYKQTNADTTMTYTKAIKEIVAKDGVWGLFGRGLGTKLISNGIQGAIPRPASTTRRSSARACEAAGEEAESKRKGQKASTNYHLSRHLRR